MKSSRRELRNFVQGGVYDPAQPGLTTRNYSYQNTQKKGANAAQAPDTPGVVKHEEKGGQQDNSFAAIGDNFVRGDENGEGIATGKKGKIPFKKIFANRKKASVRAKEKKARQNRQLRKVLVPKTALMALTEVRGINMTEFVVNADAGGGFTAVVSVNDIQYEGKGSSKMLAKNNACEKALRDFVLTKMRQKPRKKGSQDNAMDTSEGNDDHHDADDGENVPMINLASFALYKLFTEWENEGFEIPEFHPNSRQAGSTEGEPATPKEPKKPVIRNDLPQNWDTMHPATLLCVMRPGAIYSDYGLSGEKPNVVQSLGVVVDGKEYIGKGRSKKTARRNVAAIICNKLFGTRFELEDVVDGNTTAMVS